MQPQTIQLFRRRLASEDMPITQWARDNGFNPYAVYRVLNGYEQGKKGKSRITAEAIERYAKSVTA